MKHTAFAFGFAALVATGAAHADTPRPVTVLTASTSPRPSAERREHRRREHARLHDAAVRAGLATLLAPAPGQHVSALRPLLGRDERPLSGNVMTKHNKGKVANADWTDE